MNGLRVKIDDISVLLKFLNLKYYSESLLEILLYHSYLQSVITYVCETWSLTKGQQKTCYV